MSRRKQNEMVRRARRFAADTRRTIEALSLSMALPPPFEQLEDYQVNESTEEHRLVFAAFGGFPRGHYLSDAELSELRRSANYQAIRDSYLRPGSPPPGWKPKPRMTVVPTPEKRPTRDQIAALLAKPQSSDVVEAWRELFGAMCKLTGGNAALSEDILLSNPASARLAMLATRVDAERRHAGSFRRPVRPLREIGAA